MRSKLLPIVLALLVPATAFAGRHHDRWNRVDQGTFGAIAYSPSTGNIGWSYGYGDGDSAKTAATSSCGVGDCAWQVVEQNEYAVIAIGTGGPGVAWSTDYATAEQNALAACSAKGDFCTAQRWVLK
jgi:serine/threonine-protein kinase